MTTTNRTIALRCLVPVAAITLSVATAFASGLWPAKSFSLTANAVEPAVVVAAMGEPAAADVTAKWSIAPSQFVHGAGDDIYVSP